MGLKEFLNIPPNPIEQFLGKVWIDTKFFIFDNWMVVHLFTGGLIGLLSLLEKIWIIKLGYLKDPFFVLGLLIAYEIFEFLFWGRMFRQETIVNVFWDLMFGMSGWFLVRYFMS